MANFKYFLFFVLTCCLITCQSQKTQETPIAEETIEIAPLLEVDLEDAQSQSEFAPAVKVDVIYDPVFRKAKQYKAIPLKPYLQQLIETQNLDTSNTEIIFRCKDGYNPSMSLSKVMQNEPYLAIKDVAAKEGQNWMDTLQGKWTPFYLIWPNNPKEAKGFTWPYGLKFLQFKTADAAYQAAFPAGKQRIAGFELYKSKCMKCHSVNKVGGIMGPEFNIPKNITEYWQKADIKAFVKNPYAYRYNSKMPPVVGIEDAEIDLIIDYLAYMKGHKISVD